MLAKLKEIEKKAREGGCTHLVFVPGSPAELAPNASKSVAVSLETTPGNVTVQTVRWAAVAAKGSVSPTTSRDAKPTLAVKGAAKGPQTAAVNVKAVSPAGISQGTWIGQSDEAFPPCLPRHATLTSELGPITEKWTATVTYARTGQKTNPDGTKQAAYDLTAASVGTHTGAGICSVEHVGREPDDQGRRHRDPGGRGGQVDVGVPPRPAAEERHDSCPPAPPAPFTPKSFLQSGAGGSKSLRPMAPRGPIEASNVTDAVARSRRPRPGSSRPETDSNARAPPVAPTHHDRPRRVAWNLTRIRGGSTELSDLLIVDPAVSGFGISCPRYWKGLLARALSCSGFELRGQARLSRSRQRRSVGGPMPSTQKPGEPSSVKDTRTEER